MQRLCFGRQPADTRYRYHPGLPFSAGMPRSSRATFEELAQNFYLTSNKGNMLIGEAACRIFDCDKNHSCMLSVHVLHEAYGGSSSAADLLNENFDALILPMANEIRAGVDHTSLVAVLERLSIPLFVLGMGMQSRLGSDTSQLNPDTVRLLEVIDERASVFGVRGLHTEAWLKQVGFKNPVALGCPSMMLYPDNILSVASPSRDAKDLRFLTAGYLNKQSKRGRQLAEFFSGYRVSYVFQDEIFDMRGELGERPGFDDARNEFRRESLQAVMSAAIGADAPFERYFYFSDVEAWRQCCAQHDAFIGDRFHGGVAALQVGLPTVILFEDLRVREMCEFFAIPHTSVSEAHKSSPRDLVEMHFSAESLGLFSTTYRRRFDEFHRYMTSKGLKVFGIP